MAFDGIVVSGLVDELNKKIVGGRISKIAQPETDELMFTIKHNKEQYRLLMSANASLPLIYLTEANHPGPATAPSFCMLLRKHIGSGKIIQISQPGLERIITITVEHPDELGDLRRKKLIIELMGKHSNIIFCNENDKIIDSIKHVSSVISSVRQVLPGKQYFIINTMNKHNPLETNADEFKSVVFSSPAALSKAIYTNFTGISPIVAQSVCYSSRIDGDLPANTINESSQELLYDNFYKLTLNIKQGRFYNVIYYKDEISVEFSATSLSNFSDCRCAEYDSISEVLENFYAQKNAAARIKQKSVDLRRIVSTALERDLKKYNIQNKQLEDTKKREKYRIYGELITTYGYNVEPCAKSFTAFNYYTNEDITIPLDPDISVMDNAKKYFSKYNKLKRTGEALTEIIKTTAASIEYLESVNVSLDMAVSEEDLKGIRDELLLTNYIKFKSSGKKERCMSKPFHYISDDGFDIYVGKNNLQNEKITFKLAGGGDWWFHAKKIPGSHVIVKSNGSELPDGTFEQAARLAGYYSKGKNQTKVDVDYTVRKNIKKVPGTNPGFVIYHTNYSMSIVPDISDIKLLNE